jgi:hypothetical protein
VGGAVADARGWGGGGGGGGGAPPPVADARGRRHNRGLDDGWTGGRQMETWVHLSYGDGGQNRRGRTREAGYT